MSPRASWAKAVIPTRAVSSDEYFPLPQTAKQRALEARLLEMGDVMARKLGPKGSVPPYVCLPKQHPSTGRLSIDRAKIAAESRLDGKYLLATSDPDLSAEDVALGYKNLLEAERSFRTMKSTLYLRPVFHRLDDRIRAHVLLCWLALLLIRVAERRTGTTWRTIRNELGRIHQVTAQHLR